jgi:hypothetical protein
VVESPAEVETRGGFVIQMGSPTFYWDDGERLSDFFFLFDSDQCFCFYHVCIARFDLSSCVYLLRSCDRIYESNVCMKFDVTDASRLRLVPMHHTTITCHVSFFFSLSPHSHPTVSMHRI